MASSRQELVNVANQVNIFVASVEVFPCDVSSPTADNELFLEMDKNGLSCENLIH